MDCISMGDKAGIWASSFCVLELFKSFKLMKSFRARQLVLWLATFCDWIIALGGSPAGIVDSMFLLRRREELRHYVCRRKVAVSRSKVNNFAWAVSFCANAYFTHKCLAEHLRQSRRT